MYGLIIDTSRDPTILGLACEDRIEKIVLSTRDIFPQLQSFCKIKDLDYIAVGVGPGSYMGIRTGATIAKTLAFASNLPLIEFSSPLAFIPPNAGIFAFVDDAKMGQLYVLTGNTEDRSISPPLLISPAELESHLFGKTLISAPFTPHLDLVAIEVHERFIQKNFSNIASLELTYLR